MGGEARHQCGIAAVYTPDRGDASQKALFYLYKLLLNQQNRGQLSAGVTTLNRQKSVLLNTYKDLGSVNEVFRTSNKAKSLEIFKQFAGNKGIGHVRYATSGSNERSAAQPLERPHGRKWKWFSFCWNGNLANYATLKKNLMEKSDYHIAQDNDTEVLMHYLSRELKGSKRPSMVNVFTRLSEKLDGCYNIAFLNAFGELVVCRDPYGFRPVVYGWKDDMFLVASESNALRNCGVTKVHDLKPGHLIHIQKGKINIKQFAKRKKIARCMFEWVYFANVSSVIDGRSVYGTRIRLGKQLAEEEPMTVNEKDWVVVPVPDTGKAAADAMAFELKIKSREGLIRNRYVGRTFIEGGSRHERVASKFTVIPEILKNKKVILVDDSIVRGTTTKQIVKYIKEIGKAKEVHVRITCPPVRGPCFYGIDMSTIKELLVASKEKKPTGGEVNPRLLKSLAKEMGADSLYYLSLSGLVKAVGLPKESLCLGCLTGSYPTPTGKKLFHKAWHNFKNGVGERSYSCS